MDKNKRRIYDQYGEEGLRGNMAHDNRSNSFDFSSNFFHSRDPFFSFDRHDHFGPFFGSNIFDRMNFMFSNGARGFHRRKEQVLCSLEELYHGCEKLVTLRSHHSPHELAEFTIEIPPGTMDGEKFIYRLDQTIVELFVVAQKHEYYLCNGLDLIYVHKVSLAEAMLGCNLSIPTFDGSLVEITIDNVVSPGMRKVFPGKGFRDSSGEVGNLIIEFDVIFPSNISEDKRRAVYEILSS